MRKKFDYLYLDAPPYVRDFLNYMTTIRGKSPNTVKEYYYDIRLFLRFMMVYKGIVKDLEDFNKIDYSKFNVKDLNDITLSDLYAFLSYLTTERNNDAHARARRVASLRTFFNYLSKKANLIDSNPAEDLESPKIQKSLPKYLTLDESKNLLNTVDGKFKERDYAIIMLFLNCGMRLSELVSINISDIKTDTLTIIGKGNKERTVYLNNAARSALDDYLKVRNTDGIKDKDDRNALFLSSQNKRISRNMVYKIVRTFIERSGLDPNKYSVHKLRHTAATLMYQYGNVDIRALQEILGHESISTTEIYTHLDNKQLKKAVDSNPLSNITNET